MAEPTTAGFNPIDTQLLADATVPEITTPTSFIAQEVKTKASQVDLSANPFAKAPSLFGTQFKEGPRALTGYANQYYNEANIKLASGEYIARYDSFIPGTNNEERFAQNQTTSEKWANGFGKLVGKTGVAVLGGTFGVVDSLIAGVSKGSLSEAYNTNFNNWLDDLNVKLDYKLPSYYTEQEKNASFLGQTTQANFWADKVFGGLSFTAGALISEGIWAAATGGVGLLAAESQLARLAKWTVKGVGGEAKAVKALNLAKATSRGSADMLLDQTALSNANKLMGSIADATKSSAINTYKLKKIGDIALVATRSAGYESGMEARQYMNATEHTWLENYQKVNGTDPSAEEYADFKDGLTTSANAVFGANMIIVGGSNIAQFGRSLLGKTTNPLMGNNLLKRSLLGVGFDKTVSAEGKVLYTALEATKSQKVAGKVWGVLGAAIPESQEEMGQSVVSSTAENYILSAFDPQKTKTTYDVADAFTDALNHTYGSQEGWTEGLIGGIVGILGAGASSRFKFGNVSEQREDIKSNVDYVNAFTAENHLNNVIANNKILKSQENRELASQRGDLVGEQLADVESAIAYTERNAIMGNVQEGVTNFSRQINAVSNEELAKELGFGVGEEAENQAQQFKEQKVLEFKDLSLKHERNLNYAQSLLGEIQIAGLDKVSTREVVRAMAYSMTMGESAMKINQDLVGHVKALVAESIDVAGITDALDVQQVLDLAPREKTLKLSQLNLQLFNLNNKEKELVGRQIKASKVKDTTLVTPEESRARQNELLDIQQELIDLQEEKQLVEQQKQIALDSIGIKNYTNATVTVDMFSAQNENLEKLKATLKDIKLTNPERFSEIQKALEAQSKSVEHIKNYQKTVNAVVDPKTRVKVLNGWVTKLLNKNTKLNEGTASYFSDVLEKWKQDTAVTFQESNNLKERKAFQNGEEVSEEYKKQLGEEVRDGIQLNSIDQEIYNAYKKEIDDNAKATIENGSVVEVLQNQVNTLQDLKDKVKEIISSNDYLTQYFGSDLAEQKRAKPNSADITEYEDLLSKIDRKVENNTSRIVSRPTGFYKNIGLTNEETDRLKELQIKLNDWVTLEGTVTNDNQSVAEMLELIDALQTQIVSETVKTELQDTDYKATIDALDEQAKSLGSSVRGLSTPTSALVTVRNNNVRFSHIRIETLASFFPNSSLILNENKTFEITLPSGEVLRGKINERGGQDVTLKDWQAVRNLSTVLIKNFGTNSAAISQFIGLDSQGKELYQNVASDFDFQQTDGTNLVVDENAVNEVKNGDTLDLFVSSTDLFNSTLTNKELPSKVHIYVMKGGKLIGSLPAQELDSEGKVKESANGIGIALSDLRKSAVEFTKGKEGLILLPQKMTAQITFIGAPQITLEKVGEDVNTKNNPFTKEMLQNVVGQGFIENGKVTSTINIDVNQFINKVSSVNKDTKIPFVAFNYNGKIVAFPISLTSFTASKSEGIFDGLETTAQKAKVLVDTLNQNGLDASSYNINFADKENWLDSQETQDALKDLSQVKEFVDIQRFATKGYNKQNLIADATIAIDISNNPFQTSKIMLTTSDKIDSDVLGYREFLAESERKEVEIRASLNDIAKQIYSKYLANEELENKFTQAFDETPIIEGDSDITMRRNVNVLKIAIKGASAKTKAVIGADLFKKANNAIKELEYLAKKTKTVKEQIKNNQYYQDADPNFITVDEQGELENPNINQAQAIQELGGHKTEQEFKEALENTNLEYLKTLPQEKSVDKNEELNLEIENNSSNFVIKQNNESNTGSSDRKRWDTSRGNQTLEGAPINNKRKNVTGADSELTFWAEEYARRNGIEYKRQSVYVEVNEERAKRIAQAYEEMEHNPQDPKVKEAYQNLINQTIKQYETLVEAGYQFYFFDETNDPYNGNPMAAMEELRNEKKMGSFATEAGFGSGATDLNVDDNPMLQDTGFEWGFGALDGQKKRVLANDLFRAVHDAFGHGLEGASFRARGEENAWQAHARLFTGSAVAAITSETRGQNSWLNYGKYGAQNQTASVEDTVFADQKVGLMPEWTWKEGFDAGVQKITPIVENKSLFQQLSEFNRIPAKEIVNGELVDKLDTEVKDTLEATIKQPENTQLEESLLSLETFSESVWISSPQAVKTLLKEVEVRALDINVDVQGLSESGKSRNEILTLTRALDILIKDNSTQEDLEYFIAVYQDFMNVSQDPKVTVLKVAEKYRNLPLITLETQDSEYKLFKEQGLLEVQEGVYVKTDGVEKSLAEVEELLATNAQVFPPNTIKGDTNNKELVKEDLNVYAENLMADVLTNDVEYDLETVKKLIYYKTYFGTINSKKQPVNFQTQLSQLANVEINNGVYLKNDLIADVRNKQLKKEDKVLDNLMFSEKGITLRYTDEISVAEMNEYLKDNADLRNYFLLSKNTNFEVANVEQNEIFNERDNYANGATKEEYKGDYRRINEDTVQTKTSEDFITINSENYERIESDFFAKIVKNETEFLQQNVEKPTLNIDITNFSSVQSEAKSKVKNQYNKSQEKAIDESKDCSK